MRPKQNRLMDVLFAAGCRRLLCCAVLMGGLCGLSHAQPPASASSRPGTPDALVPQNNANNVEGRYRLGPGDVIEVRVYNRPQLSLEAVRLDGNGLIRLPLLAADVQAACRTESELAREIAAQYQQYQRHPQVFVFVKEYNSQPVAVIGAVEKPGRFQLQRRMRLLELLSFVGGPTDKAGLRLHVAHTGGGTTCDAAGQIVPAEKPAEDFEVYTLNETLAGEQQANPYVQPGDIVTVPEAEQAFVVGNVFKPSTIPLKTPLRLTEAVAMAGGVLPDSNTTRVRLVRQLPGAAVKQETFVNLKAINQRREEDVMLLAGDIIEVPTLSGKKFLRGLLTGIGPTLANLPLIVVR